MTPSALRPAPSEFETKNQKVKRPSSRIDSHSPKVSCQLPPRRMALTFALLCSKSTVHRFRRIPCRDLASFFYYTFFFTLWALSRVNYFPPRQCCSLCFASFGGGGNISFFVGVPAPIVLRCCSRYFLWLMWCVTLRHFYYPRIEQMIIGWGRGVFYFRVV